MIPEPDHVLTVLVDPDGGTGLLAAPGLEFLLPGIGIAVVRENLHTRQLLAVAEESEIGALWNVDPGVRIDAGDPFEAAEEVF